MGNFCSQSKHEIFKQNWYTFVQYEKKRYTSLCIVVVNNCWHRYLLVSIRGLFRLEIVENVVNSATREAINFLFTVYEYPNCLVTIGITMNVPRAIRTAEYSLIRRYCSLNWDVLPYTFIFTKSVFLFTKRKETFVCDWNKCIVRSQSLLLFRFRWRQKILFMKNL